METIFSNDLTYALGWTVLHSLWQALIIAVLVGVLNLGFKQQAAKYRYATYYIGLLAILFLSGITFMDLYQFGSDSNLQNVILISGATITDLQYLTIESPNSVVAQIIHFFDHNMPIIVQIWFMGMVFFLIRLMGGVSYIEYLKRNEQYAVPEEWQQRLAYLMHQIPVDKAVDLVESALVKMPMVIGHLKPMILLPLGTINQLAPKELEAILAHELAHIARNDYMLNILQSVIEVLFYYNPAVWWLSANARHERENCCDDMAVALCGSSLTYAKALVSLQEVQQTPPMLAMPMTGKQPQLLHRIRRILNQPQNRNNIMEKIMATCLLVFTIGLLTINANASESNNEIGLTVIGDLTYPEENLRNNAFSFTSSSATDTIPRTKSKTNNKTVIRRETNGKSIEVTRLNGNIESLEIDGKKVPKKDWDNYADEIEEVQATPPPPAPPAAPAPPSPGSTRVDRFPAPPAPPAPPVFPDGINKQKTIIITEGEEGTTFITIEKHNGEAPTQVRINEGDAIVKIDGQKIDLNESNTYEGNRVNITGTATIIDSDFSEGSSIFDDNRRFGLFESDEDNTVDGRTQLYFLGEDFNEDMSDFSEEMEELAEEMEELAKHQARWAEGQAGKIEIWADANTDKVELILENKENWLERQGIKMEELLEESRADLEDLFDEKEALFEEFEFEFETVEDLLHFDLSNNFRFHSEESNGVQAQIGKMLHEDGIINNPDKYKLVITEDDLRVNGKKQPRSVRKKYVKVYNKLTDSNMGDNYKIIINYKANKPQHSSKKTISL